jgi:hypothetical protein
MYANSNTMFNIFIDGIEIQDIKCRGRRRVHKISSVCKYCRCKAAVNMVFMFAEIVGPFGRHGRNFQTIELRLRIVLCV